jgi:hypothetical protein
MITISQEIAKIFSDYIEEHFDTISPEESMKILYDHLNDGTFVNWLEGNVDGDEGSPWK